MEILSTVLDHGGLPRTTWNLIVDKSLRHLPVRCCDDVITLKNLDEVRQLARFPRVRVCAMAVERNDVELLKAARRAGLPYGDAVDKALMLERCDLLELLVADRAPWKTGSLFRAAKRGCFAGLPIVLEKAEFPPSDSWLYYEIEKAAARNGFKALNYLRQLLPKIENFGPISYNFPEYAANLEELQQSAETSPIGPQACYNIAKRGDIDMMNWALEHGATPQARAFTVAAKQGHLPILRLLHSYNTALDYKALNEAAARGHWECVDFLFGIGAPQQKLLAAAAKHSLDMVKYCAGRFPLSRESVDELAYYATISAARRGCAETLDWLEKQGLLDWSIVAECAAEGGHWALAKRYVQRGSEPPCLHDFALSTAHSLSYADWLLPVAYYFDISEFFSSLMAQHDLELLRWALANNIRPESTKGWEEKFNLQHDPELAQLVLEISRRLDKT